MNSNEDEQITRAKLNAETSVLRWQELAPFFARGQLLRVAVHANLLDLATQMATDDRPGFEAALANGTIAEVTDEEAAEWHEQDATLWAVVVRPWVIVQQKT